MGKDQKLGKNVKKGEKNQPDVNVTELNMQMGLALQPKHIGY